MLQAKTAVASRVKQIFLAHKTVKDQEDQLRQRFSSSEWDLQQTDSLIPNDAPVKARPLSKLNEHVRLALTNRPEVLRA